MKRYTINLYQQGPNDWVGELNEGGTFLRAVLADRPGEVLQALGIALDTAKKPA